METFHEIPRKSLHALPWNSMEMSPSISIKIHFPWKRFIEFHGNYSLEFHASPGNFMGLEYPLNIIELFIIFHRILVSAMY